MFDTSNTEPCSGNFVGCFTHLPKTFQNSGLEYEWQLKTKLSDTFHHLDTIIVQYSDPHYIKMLLTLALILPEVLKLVEDQDLQLLQLP